MNKKQSKKIPAFIWIIIGIIFLAGVGWATTVSDAGFFGANEIVNISNIYFGNTSGTYGETIAGRPLTTNYQRQLNVCPSGCEFTTIQSAINQVPFFLRHNWTINISSGTYDEDLYFPSMITVRKHPTEGSVTGLSVRGNNASINDVKVKSIQTTGIIGANGLQISYMQIYGNESSSDEQVSVSVYGSNKVLMHHINFTNSSINYAVMAYSSNLEVHSSFFNNMKYAGLSKVQSNLRLGDNYQGSTNNGTLTTAIAFADDASFVFIEEYSLTRGMIAPLIIDGSGIGYYGFNSEPNLFLNQGSIRFGNNTDSTTTIYNTNITTSYLELNRGQANSFLTNNNNPLIYATGQSGTYPFTTTGNLVIQPRTSTQNADIVFAVGDNTPDIPFIIDGGTARPFFGNGTSYQNFSMVSPNFTIFNCGVNNSGSFSCS